MRLSDPSVAAEPGPRLSVLAVVTRPGRRNPEVLLVRRANPPQSGHWGFPGGKVAWGEDLRRAAIRELWEETGIEGTNPVVFDILDLIVPGLTGDLTDGRAAGPYHHLMVAVRLDCHGSEPLAGDDALEARWVPTGVLPAPLCGEVARIVAEVVAAATAGHP